MDGDSATSDDKPGSWQDVINKLTSAVVVMRMNSVRSFDGNGASYSYATGFVVDAKRGIIVSNRHVVTTGPVNAEALFYNKEEIRLRPIYRDPVHDFGFFHFSPDDVKYLKVAEIPLHPEGAVLGTDIRVIGNDAGEKLAVLAGTLARLDRDAPVYGGGADYSDINTFYFGAASSTSGGSSGSPVINIKGQAIAINAGGRKSAASSFYLPLDRVKRALTLIQQGVQVPRASLLAIFNHKPFGELRRLGVSPETESAVRENSPDETGMLVVKNVIKKGPSDEVLQPGDILVSINGVLVTHFIPLEDVLDATGAVYNAIHEQHSEVGIQRHVEATGDVDALHLPDGCLCQVPGVPPMTSSTTSNISCESPIAKRKISPGTPSSASGAGAGAGAGAAAGASAAAGAGAAAGASAGAAAAAGAGAGGEARVESEAIAPSCPFIACRSKLKLQDVAKRVLSPEPGQVPVSNTLKHAFCHTIKSRLSPEEAAAILADAPADLDFSSEVPPSALTCQREETTWQQAGPVDVVVERGGVRKTFTIFARDLHTANPSSFLTISGSVVHSLSYIAAMNCAIPIGGLYVSQPGFMLAQAGVPNGAVLVAVGKTPVSTLDELEKAFAALHDGCRTSVKFYMLGDSHRERLAVIDVDRQWHLMQVWHRDDALGTFLCRRCDDAPEAPPPKPMTTSYPTCKNPLATRLFASLVGVSFVSPFLTDGLQSWAFEGVGVVLDERLGLVCVDRNTCPSSLGDVLLTFASSIEVPGRLVFLHPVHNFSIIQYDPALLGDTPVKAVTLSEEPLAAGFRCEFVGMTEEEHGPVVQSCTVTRKEVLTLARGNVPRFRAINEVVVHFDNVSDCLGGVFADPSTGDVVALWVTYSYVSSGKNREVFQGMLVDSLRDVVECFRAGKAEVAANLGLWNLDVEFVPEKLAKARMALGLPDDIVAELEVAGGENRQVLSVRRCLPCTDAHEKLLSGDLVVAIDDKIVVQSRDVEAAVRNKEEVVVKVIRDMEPLTITVKTSPINGFGTDRMISWSGMLLQKAHRAVGERGVVPLVEGKPCPDAPYVSRWSYGSPAHKYGVRATQWITEVNGLPTPDLDAFMEVTSTIGAADNIRIKLFGLSGKEQMFTLKPDLLYWPTNELRRSPVDGVWRHVESEE